MGIDRIPEHIGIILDGNRRFAKKLMKMPWKGHEWGTKKLKEVLGWCREFGIKYTTVYALSIENIFKRPKNELNYILKIFSKELKEILDKKHVVHKYGIRIKVIGRVKLLPKNIQNLIRKVENSTKDYKNYFLNLAIAYGGQQEITDAFQKLAMDVSKGILKPQQINEVLIKESLYTNGTPYPDLIIRTGSEKRLSNFLIWQSAYAELFFLDTCWPELTKKEFVSVIEEYQRRERRFGK